MPFCKTVKLTVPFILSSPRKPGYTILKRLPMGKLNDDNDEITHNIFSEYGGAINRDDWVAVYHRNLDKCN